MLLLFVRTSFYVQPPLRLYQRALGCTVAPSGQAAGRGVPAVHRGALVDFPDDAAEVPTDGIDDAGMPWNESEVCEGARVERSDAYSLGVRCMKGVVCFRYE